VRIVEGDAGTTRTAALRAVAEANDLVRDPIPVRVAQRNQEST